MQNITVVFSCHVEDGNCTSDGLYKIIESISPEVIFEKIPSSIFNEVYFGNHPGRESNEVKSINKYLLNNKIDHIPVDIDPSPTLSKSEIDRMFHSFNSYLEYFKLDIVHEELTKTHGFAYLNSNKCSELFAQKQNIEKFLLSKVDPSNILNLTYKLFHEEIENRENTMLQNIYNYSKVNQYNQGLFWIGAGHRNSIVKKTAEFNSKENKQLNWIFLNTEFN